MSNLTLLSANKHPIDIVKMRVDQIEHHSKDIMLEQYD
jgi:hypothetical protein